MGTEDEDALEGYIESEVNNDLLSCLQFENRDGRELSSAHDATRAVEGCGGRVATDRRSLVMIVDKRILNQPVHYTKY